MNEEMVPIEVPLRYVKAISFLDPDVCKRIAEQDYQHGYFHFALYYSARGAALEWRADQARKVTLETPPGTCVEIPEEPMERVYLVVGVSNRTASLVIQELWEDEFYAVKPESLRVVEDDDE